MSELTSKAGASFASFNRALAWFHRWTGVVLCLLFLIWFASGAVLSFVPFPALSDRDRLAGYALLRASDIAVSPGAALNAAGGGRRLQLIGAARGAVYIVEQADGLFTAIDAKSGATVPSTTAGQARAAAVRFGGAPAVRVDGPLRYDQWVVHQGFDPWRPFYRVSLNDGLGTQLYVSARTGEVVQRTRAAERAWNWVGAVVHWIYFTALRKSFTAWDQTVWWVALAGTATTIVGAWLGVYRTAKRMSGQRPDWSPFRGWLRWHHGVGLAVALFVITWIASGWLSMDHGRLFSRGIPAAAAQARYDGAGLGAALRSVRIGALSPLLPAARISFNVMGGQVVVAAEGGGRAPRVLLPASAQPPSGQLPIGVLATAAASGWPLADRTPRGPEVGDALYRLAEEMPDRAISFALAKPNGAYLYVDPLTGQVLTVMDRSRQAYAWVYYAVHTFKFPFLIGRPVLRRTVEFIPITLGLAFSLTGLVIAVRRVQIAAGR